MQSPLKVIEQLGVSTTSYSAAIQDLNSSSLYSDAGKENYEQLVAEIIGMKKRPVFENEKDAKFHFLYSVQETIRAFQTGVVPDMEQVWNEVTNRVNKLRQDAPWSFMEFGYNGQQTERVDAAGNPKPKKGAKKELAEKLYKENKDKGLTRKQFIELFVKEVGLTESGASTYHANLKKQFG